MTKRRSPQVQRIVAQDGKPVHDAAWIGENQLATVCSYDNDGLVHVWHLGRSAPVAELTHGVTTSKFDKSSIMLFTFTRKDWLCIARTRCTRSAGAST